MSLPNGESDSSPLSPVTSSRTMHRSPWEYVIEETRPDLYRMWTELDPSHAEEEKIETNADSVEKWSVATTMSSAPPCLASLCWDETEDGLSRSNLEEFTNHRRMFLQNRLKQEFSSYESQLTLLQRKKRERIPRSHQFLRAYLAGLERYVDHDIRRMRRPPELEELDEVSLGEPVRKLRKLYGESFVVNPFHFAHSSGSYSWRLWSEAIDRRRIDDRSRKEKVPYQRRVCRTLYCSQRPMMASDYCFSCILKDPRQKLYRKCSMLGCSAPLLVTGPSRLCESCMHISNTLAYERAEILYSGNEKVESRLESSSFSTVESVPPSTIDGSWSARSITKERIEHVIDAYPVDRFAGYQGQRNPCIRSCPQEVVDRAVDMWDQKMREQLKTLNNDFNEVGSPADSP